MSRFTNLDGRDSLAGLDNWITGGDIDMPSAEQTNQPLSRTEELLRQYRRDMQFPNLDDGQRQRRIEAIDEELRAMGVEP